MSSKIISYEEAMNIVENGKFYRQDTNHVGMPLNNVVCDYCNTSKLSGAWKIQEQPNIDLCMNCFIKLRNVPGIGQSSLPVVGNISGGGFVMTKMMQDSVLKPEGLGGFVMTNMMQDSVKPKVYTYMMQDSVRKPTGLGETGFSHIRPKQYNWDDMTAMTATLMMQDSVKPYNSNIEPMGYNMFGSGDNKYSEFINEKQNENKKDNKPQLLTRMRQDSISKK